MATSTPENNSPNPLISVVIPTFNRANTIINTLTSVQKQDYIHFECLVVDDSSEDHTKQVIEQFSAADNRFKYIANQNTKGAAGARNTGLKFAAGKYIMFLDSDDLLLEHALTNRVTAFKAQPELDLVIANQATLKNGLIEYLVNIPTITDPIIRFYSLYPRTDIPWINNTLIRKDFLLKAKISWQENLERYQDIQFNLHTLLAKPKYKWLATDVDSYWVHADGETSIGKNLHNYDQKLIDITMMYLETLQSVADKFQEFYHLIKKHIKAFCSYSLFDLTDKNQAQTYYHFISLQGLFSTADLFLLRQYHQQHTWLMQKAIRLNFKLKLHAALNDNLFLKVKYAASQTVAFNAAIGRDLP